MTISSTSSSYSHYVVSERISVEVFEEDSDLLANIYLDGEYFDELVVLDAEREIPTILSALSLAKPECSDLLKSIEALGVELQNLHGKLSKPQPN